MEEQGIKIYNSQIASNIDDFKPDYLVKTAAILPHNEEVRRATELELQIFDRAEFLGAFTRSYKNVINVSGTHGKTTTTSMISLMMIDAALDPTVHLGADLDIFCPGAFKLVGEALQKLTEFHFGNINLVLFQCYADGLSLGK